MGTILTDSTLRNVRFKNCNLSYSNFGFSDFKQVIFEKSLLNYAAFENILLSKVGFDENNMKSMQMNGTKLKGIDLSTSEIDGMGVRVDDLNEVRVTKLQAIELSTLLGLIITD